METPSLHIAARYSSPEMVQVLLDAGVQSCSMWLTRLWIRTETPLSILSLFMVHPEVDGSPEKVQILLEAGADIHALDKAGNTPLHRAAIDGSPEMVQVLADAGANIDAVDKVGRTLLHRMTIDGSPKKVQVLPMLEPTSTPWIRMEEPLSI